MTLRKQKRRQRDRDLITTAVQLPVDGGIHDTRQKARGARRSSEGERSLNPRPRLHSTSLQKAKHKVQGTLTPHRKWEATLTIRCTARNPGRTLEGHVHTIAHLLHKAPSTPSNPSETNVRKHSQYRTDQERSHSYPWEID